VCYNLNFAANRKILERSSTPEKRLINHDFRCRLPRICEIGAKVLKGGTNANSGASQQCVCVSNGELGGVFQVQQVLACP
jgi:hypothetical protein